MAKITSFLIGLIVVVMCVSIFAIFLSQMSDGYGEKTGMSQEDLALLNKMDNLTADTAEIQEDVTSFTEKDNPFDIIGNFFSSGWKSLKLAGNSINLLSGDNGIIEVIMDKTNLGDAGQILKIGIMTIVSIFIFIGILLSALVKKDL